VNKHWKEIKNIVKDAELIICGKVCEKLEFSEEGVILKGLVPSLEPYYRSSAVVLSPIQYGTGLKIKATEAIAFGKCLLSTEEGVLGLHRDVYGTAKVVDFDDMGQAAINLLCSVEEINHHEKQSQKFANEHLLPEKIYNDITAYLEKGKAKE
jgi:succinoglycan biosynthesis protein ExoO